MIVLLDGEGAKAPLPHVATGVVMLLVAAELRRHQPHHVSAQLAIPPWPDGKVEMIRHQTKGDQPHVHALLRLAQQPDEGVEVAVLMKDGRPTVAAIKDVITIPT